MGKPGNIVPQQKYFRICWETFLLPAKIGFADWLHSEEVGQLLAKHHGKFACALPIGFIYALTSAK